MEDYLKELRKRTNHMPLLLPHSVVVLFNEKGEVLLEERADDGYFDFPGGGIDLKESAFCISTSGITRFRNWSHLGHSALTS